MKRSSQTVALVAALLALPAAGIAGAGTDVYRALDGDRVMIITYDGKPPHRHRIVRVQDLSPAEFARFEETNADVLAERGNVGKKVRVVERGGKPPFTQRVVTVTEENAAEFSRFEETDTPSPVAGKPGEKVRVIERSGKPPFTQRVVTVAEDSAAEPARAEGEAKAPR